MCEGKVRKLNLPNSAQGGWFSVCSKGLLFLGIGTDVQNLRIFLFDPISRAQIPLPPLSTISSFEDSFVEKRSEWNSAACIIAAVEVSSSDASQCIVVVTFCENGRILGLCTPQIERWTIVEGLLPDGYYYGDLFFSHGDLYACILTNSDEADNNQPPNLQLHSVTLGSHRVNLKLICATPPPTYLFHAAVADDIIQYYKDFSRWSYFVESNGELLMITQTHDAICTWNVNDEYVHDEEDNDQDVNGEEDNDHYDEGEVGEDNNDEGEIGEDDNVEDENGEDEYDEDDGNLLLYYQAATFQVYKIQTTDDILSITKITDLGNQSLFLGDGCCLAAENPDKFDKNCIYFLQDNDNGYSCLNEDPLVCREAGVYYLEDGSIKTDNHNLCMHWFSPNLGSY